MSWLRLLLLLAAAVAHEDVLRQDDECAGGAGRVEAFCIFWFLYCGFVGFRV